MKTILKLGISSLLIIVVVAYFIGSSLLNKSIEAGVELLAPKILGVPVTLEKVSINPLSGSGTITGLFVGNPEGFTTDKLLSVDQIHVDLSVSSITSGLIHIEKILVDKPSLNYEKTLRSSNIATILDQLKSTESETAKPQETKTESEAIKLRIDECSIQGGNISASLMGQSLTIPMPPLVLNNIGENGGVTPTKAIIEVLGSVLQNVVGAVVSGDPNNLIDSGKNLLKDGKKSAKDAIQGVKSLFGK